MFAMWYIFAVDISNIIDNIANINDIIDNNIILYLLFFSLFIFFATSRAIPSEPSIETNATAHAHNTENTLSRATIIPSNAFIAMTKKITKTVIHHADMKIMSALTFFVLFLI